MVLVPADLLQQAAQLIGCNHEPVWLAEERAYRRGWADCEAAARREREAAEGLDADEPGPWPVRQLGPLPRIDPALDQKRYPPNGRKRFAEPRPGDFIGRGTAA